MKLLFKTPFLLFFISLLFTACSKEKQIEKNLSSKGGEWNIDNVEWTIVQQSSSGQSVKTGSTDNAGTFSFEEGDGTFSYTIDTLTRSGEFNWIVDEETVSMTSISQSFSMNGSMGISQKSVAYTATQSQKGKLVVEGAETDQEVGSTLNQFVITATFNLSKK